MAITITQIAEEIHDELEDSSVVLASITNWIRANVGMVNNVIDTSLSINDTTSEFTPDIDDNIKDIIKYLYFLRYYDKKAKAAFSGADSNGILSISDDKSSVRYVNKNEIGKSYLVLRKEYQSELDKRVFYYRHNLSTPRDNYDYVD